MLVDFTVQNFRSIKEEAILSLVATENHTLTEDKITHLPDLGFNLLKSAVIYGANASGKSNIILALLYLKQFIVNSTNIKLGQKIPFYEPYCLDKECILDPTIFEIEFVLSNISYKYKIIFDSIKIHNETLILVKKGKESIVYERIFQNIKFGKIFKGNKKHLVDELLENNLFLTKGANSNLNLLKDVYIYFMKSLRIEIQTESDSQFMRFLLDQNINDEFDNKHLIEYKSTIEKFLKSADIGISEIRFNKKYINENSTINSVVYEPIFLHDKFHLNQKIGVVEFKMHQESKGTIKMFDLALKVINVLNKGLILIIDELDASFHPLLTEYILSLFNDSKHNPHNAQLIFSTHETSILTLHNFREDQIWFAEKNKYGESSLFSLAEFEKNDVRSAKSLQNWYLTGRFGALPVIDKLEMYEIE